MTELIMWKDVQKSTFWFGFGSLCFLSSCFTKGINFRSATVFFLLFLYLWPFSLLCIVNNSEVFFVIVVSASSLLSHNLEFYFWLFLLSQILFVKGIFLLFFMIVF